MKQVKKEGSPHNSKIGVLALKQTISDNNQKLVEVTNLINN
mgnify:CR=1 FL=1